MAPPEDELDALEADLLDDPELAAAPVAEAVTTTTEPEPFAEDVVSGPAGTAVAVAVTTATPLWDEPVVIVSSFPRVVEAGARAEVMVKVKTPLASVVVEVAMTVSDEGAEEELERGDGKMGGMQKMTKGWTETCQRRRTFEGGGSKVLTFGRPATIVQRKRRGRRTRRQRRTRK